MKIKFVLTLIIFSGVYSLQAQNYDSIVKPGKKWYYQVSRIDDITRPAGTIVILPNTRNYKGLSYHQVKSQACYNFDSIWAREEDKKIYFLNLQDSIYRGHEVLMYDFNLEKGDTFRFKTPFRDSFFKARLVVDTTYFKDNRKHIIFKKGDVYEFTFGNPNGSSIHQIYSWVEGIGAPSVMLYYAFERHSFEFFEVSCYVSCLFDNQKQILPVSGNCDSLLNTQRNERVFLKIYPNPTQGQFKIQLNSSENHVLQIFDSFGQKLDEIELEGALNYSIPCHYNTGIYFLKVSKANYDYYTKLIVE